jgi:hypothetical protein
MTDRKVRYAARLLCRLGLHRWEIWYINLSGHQSYRERRCIRCREAFQRQEIGYFGNPVGKPWKDIVR